MFRRLKNVFAVVMVCSFVFACAAPAMAASGDVSVKATVSNGMKIMLNGQPWTPKDATSGEYLKPIVYNGKVYLPVRAVVQEAAGMPLDFDTATQTIWIGGKKDILSIKDKTYYEDYYGTIVTTDAAKLTTPGAAYKWGITNDKDVSMEHFVCNLKPAGKYKMFRTSVFLDSSATADLIINVRKDKYDGEVIKTITVKPGETISNIDVDINGLSQICLEADVRINHGTIKKIVYGEPIFYNGTIDSTENTAEKIY